MGIGELVLTYVVANTVSLVGAGLDGVVGGGDVVGVFSATDHCDLIGWFGRGGEGC